MIRHRFTFLLLITLNCTTAGFLAPLHAAKKNKLLLAHCSCGKKATQLTFKFLDNFLDKHPFSKRYIAHERKLVLNFPAINLADFNPQSVARACAQLKQAGILEHSTLSEHNGTVHFSMQFNEKRTHKNVTTDNKLLLGFRKITDTNDQKLIIDLYTNEQLDPHVYLAASDAIKADYASIHLPKEASKDLKNLDIFIDAGHGGADSGAVGHNGMLEKNIALKIARTLAKSLQSRGYKRVHLIRASDEALSSNERAALAAQLNTSFMLSIHLNADVTNTTKSSGIETLYMRNYNQDAPQEQRDYLFVNQDASTDLINYAENDLSKTLDRSKILASSIQNALVTTLSQHGHQARDRGIKDENCLILLNSSVPTAIVEVGFITNPQEAKLLNTHHYQKLVVDGIINGIEKYQAAL